MASLKVALKVLLRATPVAVLAGKVESTVGAVVSEELPEFSTDVEHPTIVAAARVAMSRKRLPYLMSFITVNPCGLVWAHRSRALPASGKLDNAGR